MEISVKKLSEKHVVATTAKRANMKLSNKAEALVFKMFTTSIYSNPIGTIVREIASNSFDSHVEAGVNTPILIKLFKDAVDNSNYISFIDYGVGISPDRMEKVFSVYFESTKNTNNNEIGGFGIGGKTPLAYKRYFGEGEGEYDNSFFIITVSNGVKYVYNIFEGETSPEYLLLHQEETDEHNGTEVRIAVLSKDIKTFEREIIRQLYYFENIVFDGFSSAVTNDYKLVRGKNFIYRGTELFENIHVCLGRVAYPIDYNVLNLYDRKYRIPIALNIPIGEISVVASREQLDYSEQTIKYLKKKIDLAVEELEEMSAQQLNGVKTLEDYYDCKLNRTFEKIYLDQKNDIKLNISPLVNTIKLKFINFQFNDLNIPTPKELFEFMYNIRVLGVREYKYSHRDQHERFDRDYQSLIKVKNIYNSEPATTLRVRKNAYLKHLHGRVYVVTPKMYQLTTSDGVLTDKVKGLFQLNSVNVPDDTIKTIKALLAQYSKMINTHTHKYEDVDVPEDFVHKTTARKYNTNQNITVMFNGSYKDSVKLKDLFEFQGRIFYSDYTQKDFLYHAQRLYAQMFDEERMAAYYREYDKEKFVNSRYRSDKKVGILFITISKTNTQYMEMCKNAQPIENVYNEVFKRKEKHLITNFKFNSIRYKYDDLPKFVISPDFEKISKKWSNAVKKFLKHTKIKEYSSLHISSPMYNYLKEQIGEAKLKLSKADEKQIAVLDELKNVLKKNGKILNYISYNSIYDKDLNIPTELLEILKKTLTF